MLQLWVRRSLRRCHSSLERYSLGFSDSRMQMAAAFSLVSATSGSITLGLEVQSVSGGSNSAAAKPAIASSPSQSMAAGVREEAGSFGGVCMAVAGSGADAARFLVAAKLSSV